MSENKVVISAMGAYGEGVADTSEGRLFVPFALPGETVTIFEPEGRPGLQDVLVQSPERVTPICPHFGICGGCQLQHWAQAPYLAFKRELVVSALKRQGIDTKVGDTISAHGVGRRRATLHARDGIAGYTERRSHDIHPIDRCPILVPALAEAAPAIARAAGEIAGPCDVALTASDTGIDVAIRSKTSRKAPDFAALAKRFPIARIALNGELRLLLRQPVVRMGKAEVQLPIESFLQATAEAETVLADLVIHGARTARRVADLFCGVGPFALRLAEHAQVKAFDADAKAVGACQAALSATPGLKSLGAERRDLFRDPLVPQELEKFDCVVFDPPRAGAEAQARELARSKVKRVVGVSCNPTSFARDAAILLKGGYRLEQVTPVDQFRYTPHVELVGIFRR